MEMAYMKLFIDSLTEYRRLTDEEFGRLIRSALEYMNSGAEPDEDGMGREALLWDGMRMKCDRDMENYQSTVVTKSDAGKKGAASRWNGKNATAISANGKNADVISANGKNGQEKEKETRERDKRQEKEEEAVYARANLLTDREMDEAAASATADMEEITTAAENAGMTVSYSVAERLELLRANLGKQKVLDAISEAVGSNTQERVSINYIEAIANGTGKPKTRGSPKRTAETAYEQRPAPAHDEIDPEVLAMIRGG